MTAIVLIDGTPMSLLLDDSVKNKDHRGRLQSYIDWLARTGGDWLNPDLAAYRDNLMSDERLARAREIDPETRTREPKPAPPLSAASAGAHLSTIRKRYKVLLANNRLRDALEAAAVDYCLSQGYEANPANVEAAVNRVRDRLRNATDPMHSAVEQITHQDEADDRHVRLTAEQAEALIAAPLDDRNNSTLQKARDSAILALLICTGIRDMELCALDVGDLRRTYQGELALEVREGKGKKQRLVLYGGLDDCLVYVDTWLLLAGITEGAVFRGIRRGGEVIRVERLTTRAVQDILNRYPISIGGKLRTINPHDTRRTYARLMHDTGTLPLAIQQNLGHASLDTTLGYIGKLDISARLPSKFLKLPGLKHLVALTHKKDEEA